MSHIHMYKWARVSHTYPKRCFVLFCGSFLTDKYRFWVSRLICVCLLWYICRTRGSCHTYERVTSSREWVTSTYHRATRSSRKRKRKSVFMSHVTPMKESRLHIKECVTQIWMNQIFAWVSHVHLSMSHEVIKEEKEKEYLYKSCHTCKFVTSKYQWVMSHV